MLNMLLDTFHLYYKKNLDFFLNKYYKSVQNQKAPVLKEAFIKVQLFDMFFIIYKMISL